MEISETYKHSLNYSTCNEDFSSESEALKIGETDEILCLTGSGGPPLNFLTENPKKIISVDFNPVQNWLLELKMVSMKNLNYEAFSSFIGLKKMENRVKIFDKIKDDLSEEAKDFWTKNKRFIANGFLFQGKMEKYSKYFSDIIKMTMSEKLDRMFSFTCLTQQKDYYRNEWREDPNWKSYLESAMESYYSNKETEPIYEILGDDSDFKHRIEEEYDRLFTSHLLRENHILCLGLDGNYDRLVKLPVWLQEENFEYIKKNLHKIEIKNSDILSYLKKSEQDQFSKIALSNVVDYLNNEEYELFYKYIIKCAKNNAKICMRSLNKREIPSEYAKIIIRDEELEKILEARDLVVEYKFTIGEILW